MFFGLIHVCVAARSSTCVIVAVTLAGVASEAFVIPTPTPASVVFGAIIETGFGVIWYKFF